MTAPNRDEDWKALVEVFLAESLEMLDETEGKLIELEKVSQGGQADSKVLNLIFRLFHSLKGSAAALQLDVIKELTHTAENLLVEYRENRIQIEADHIDLLCQTCDFIRLILNEVGVHHDDEHMRGMATEIKGKILKVLSDSHAKAMPVIPTPTQVEVGTANGVTALTSHAATPAAGAGNSTDRASIGSTHVSNLPPFSPPFTSSAPSSAFAASAPAFPATSSPAPLASGSAAASACPAVATAAVTAPVSDLAAIGVAPSARKESTGRKASDFEEPMLAGSLESLKLDLTPEMLRRFSEEAEELFEEGEQALLIVEKNPESTDELSKAFRALHSFKGNAGFFGFNDLERLSHAAENVLDRVRKKEIPPDRIATTAILKTVDHLRAAVRKLPVSPQGTIEGLQTLLDDLSWVSNPSSSQGKGPKLGELLVFHGFLSEDALSEVLTLQKNLSVGAPAVGEKLPEAGNQHAAPRQSIRVDTEKLDRLVELVGELVIAQSNLANCPELTGLRLERLNKDIDRFAKITKDLQRLAMAVRMVPISGLFRKMVRPIRDLARTLRKEIDLKILGEDTEIDKNVLELLRDPLTHLIRNAVDHGIESGDIRRQNGKPPAGMILLDAHHSGGEIWISVQDDGRGLDRSKIYSKACKLGLTDRPNTDFTDSEIFEFIFEPGFSTAETVTEISGRGVGMDVVRKNIEALKGRIDIRSTMGQGSHFILRIPLTLSIIDGMVIRIGNERYVIPTQSIVEFFRPLPDSITTISNLGEAVMIRDNLIPFFRVANFFHLPNAEQDPTKAQVMVIDENHQRIGLMVDEILGQQQTVIKSLGGALRSLQGISGAAVMPDGRVGLILDPPSLVSMLRKKS